MSVVTLNLRGRKDNMHDIPRLFKFLSHFQETLKHKKGGTALSDYQISRRELKNKRGPPQLRGETTLICGTV